MVKRYLHLLLAVVLLVTMVPMLPAQAAGSGSFFVWDDLPTTVNTQRISLSGLLNQVASSGITYTVEQLSENNEVLQKREKNAIGITVSSDGKQINVVNLQLFPGNNRVTFYGKRGSSEVSEYFTVKYIDAPILYNLQFIGGSEKKRLNDASETIVTNKNTSSAAQSQFTIEGNAPNASKVIIEYGDNQSRDVAVREDGTDYFVASQIKLNKGKNTIKFKVKNDSQTIEVTREVVYFDDSVTFYDTKMKYDDTTPANNDVESDLKLLPNMFVPDTNASNYSISGRVIVPNDYSTNSIGDMRIESAYRKAGDAVGSGNDPVNPDKTDKIVVRFSQEVNNPPSTLSGVLNMIDFQVPLGGTSASGFKSVNELLTDSTVAWRTFVDTGTANSVLELSIGANDAAKLAGVSRIVLRDNVEAKKDVNKYIDVMAYNREITRGDDGVAEVNTITVTNGATATGTVTVLIKNGATTTPIAVPVAAGDQPKEIAAAMTTKINAASAGYTATNDQTDATKVVITKGNAGVANTAITFVFGATGVNAVAARATAGVDAVKEVSTLEVTAGATSDGSVKVTVKDGPTSLPSVSVNVTNGKPLSDVALAIKDALIADATFPTKYDAAIDPAAPGKVMITKKTAGAANTQIDFDGGTTGITAASTKTTAGVDAVKEVSTIVVSSGATAYGTINVGVKDGAYAASPASVAVAPGDSPATIASAIVTKLSAALTGKYDVALDPVVPKVIVTKQAAGAANTVITLDLGAATGVTATTTQTTAGVDPVKEIQEITATSGVTKATPINVYFNDGTIDLKIPVALSATDDTPAKVAARIQNAFLTDSTASTYFGLEGTTPAKTYSVTAVTSSDETFQIKKNTAGKVNISFWVDGPYPYTKIVPLAGSFDHTKPYVTEIYAKGSSVTSSTRGVDSGEKLIVQFEDGSTSHLPTTQTSYNKATIDGLIKVAGKTLGSNSNYSMIYYETTHRLEIVFDSATGLDDNLTTSRVPDSGVGNGSAAVAAFTGSGDFNNVQATGNAPQVGGSFDASAAVPNPNPDTIGSLPKFARIKFMNDALTELSTVYYKLNKIPGADYSNTAPYYVFSFSIPDSSASYPGPLAFDKQYFVQMEALNTVKTRLAGGSSVYEGTDQTELGYTLVNATNPYITSMSYNQTKAATSIFSDIDSEPASKLVDGAVVNQAPFGIKLTVMNGITVTPIGQVTIKSSPVGSTSAPKDVSVDTANFAYNDNSTTKTREIWFWINKLPYDGAQTLTINYGGATATAKITFVAGVYVQFDKITDGLVNRYDPTDDQQAKSIVEDVLGNFRGSLMNVPMDEIYYTDDASGNKQNVTLTVNNTKIPLRQQPSGTKNKFELDPGSSLTQAQKDVRKLLFDGQNTISISYVRKDDKGNTIINYQKSYTFTLFSLNFPEIPKGTSDSIYPYGTDRKTPARDSRFTGSNGSYTTKEVEMNIYGTFDFINLGNKDSTIKAKLNSSDIENGKYVFRVVGPDGKSLEWDLKQSTFTSKNGKKTYNTKDPSGDLDGDLSIVYNDSSDENEQYFEFILKGQKLPSDGTKKVYNFYVYNNGVTGPYASYRLEVGASGLPYKLLRPVVQRMVPATINQNYLDVILYADGADSVTVNKQEASKVDFDGNYDGDVNDSGIDYPGSFKATVKDLKPNKVNTITFTIKRGSDSITDSFSVYYALANIPGAQYMETMKASHKIFDGKLNLTFPKNTYLRRVDYNVPENYRTQVFKGHNILFAIANEKDGVVDRYDYIDPKPSGFANLVEELGLTFYSSFDTHFIKASQVYWLDAGLADDPDTSDYDAVDTGLLPHQLPDTKPSLPSFDSVPTNRMLAPTERGSLELAYDPSIVSAASNNITVMRYDPENRYWENLGGIVNTSKKTIKVPFDKFGYYVVAKMNDSFQDVIRHPYARNHIEAMYSKGVIRPKRANEFAPDDDTTRGEFTAMVVRALQLPLVEKPSTYSFDDVPTIIDRNSLWDYRYIETASRLGLVRGTNPRIFEPNLRITRQEAAVILARALQLKVETSAQKTDKDLQKLFKDYNLIDSYARPYVLAIAKKGFIQGSPIDVNDLKKGYTFDPSANMLRGDAAILMGRVMADQKKIPVIGEVK